MVGAEMHGPEGTTARLAGGGRSHSATAAPRASCIYISLCSSFACIAASIMYEFTSNITSLLCCVPLKRHETSHDAPSDLRTLQLPASTLSVPLPYNTVPHSSSESHSEDTRALHHIFSSSSSIRGYQTAATTPAYVPTSRPSLDLDFKFGETRISPSKPPSRIEQIGNHIKQRLSDSRLSKLGSRHSFQDSQENGLHGNPHGNTANANNDAPMATSQSSIGLSNILASGNGSRVGYDSDAKSLNSPVLDSDAGTIKVGSGFVKHMLEMLEPHHRAHEVSLPSSSSPPRAEKVQSQSACHPQSQYSPFPALPDRTSFADALHMDKDESPKALLRRLSAGIADGTIKIPGTPELRTARLPSLREIDTDWRLSAPRRSSSLPRERKAFEAKLQQVHAIVADTGKGSSPGKGEEGKRTSLISELDPTLLDYIDNYCQRYSTVSTDKEALKSPTDNGPQDDQPLPKSKTAPPVPDADRDSIHLFNMRISQQLASRSRLPVTSPTSSLNASCRSLMPTDDYDMGAAGSKAPDHRPGIAVREHNRRPSDPRTLALFEAELGFRDPSCSWKTVTPAPSATSYAGLRSSLLPVTRNTSSCYLSDDDTGKNALGKKVNDSRPGSYINPHSLAIGGRSVSAKLSASHSEQKSKLLSPADSGWSQQVSSENHRSSEDSWEAPTRVYQRGRSTSMPQKRPHREYVSPTPNPKRFRQRTEDAETLSEISVERALDRRNERLTEISLRAIKTKRDEQLSEIDHSILPSGDGSISRRSGKFSDLKRSVKHEQEHHSMGLARSMKPCVSSIRPPLKPCATEKWEQAFDRAAGWAYDLDRLMPGLSLVPYGRRKSFDTIDNTNSAVAELKRASICSSRRSRSVDDLRRSSTLIRAGEDSDLGHNTHVSFPTALPDMMTTSLGANEPRHSAMEPKQRKKSILDLRRHFATTPSTSADAAGTPFKELMSIWSRFPSHTRAARNRSAGIGDDVLAHDFVDIGPLGKTEGKSPAFGKGKKKGMTVREPLSRDSARNGRRGILGKWKRIYRSSSTDLRKYALNYGHRSSISVGGTLEYPELECLPGEAKFIETHAQRMHTSLSDGSPCRSKDEPPAVALEVNPRRRREAVDWGKYYGDCVGSLSALKSEFDLNDRSTLSTGDPADVKSLDMRDSTVNFQEAIGREQEQLRQQLIDQIGRFDGAAGEDEESRDRTKRISSATASTTGTVLASSIRTKDLKIPGSFGG